MEQYIPKSTLVAELKRLLEFYLKEIEDDKEDPWAIDIAKRDILQEILSFIDTLEVKDLQEEPVSNIWHNASEPPIIDKTFLLVAPNGNSSLCLWGGKELHSVTIGGGHSVLCKGDIYSYIDDLLNLDNSCNFEKNLQEEPVSEEFEKALAEEWKGYTERGAATVDALEDNTQELAFAKGFYRGSKWQREKDESTTEDLGKYINELSKQFPEVSFAKLSRIAVRVANWQKQQMMKDAVDGEIFCAVAYPHQPKAVSKPISGGYKFGDKVKMILIKED